MYQVHLTKSEIQTRNFSGDRHQLRYNLDHDGPLQNTIRLEHLMYSNLFLFLNRFPVAKQTVKSLNLCCEEPRTILIYHNYTNPINSHYLNIQKM